MPEPPDATLARRVTFCAVTGEDFEELVDLRIAAMRESLERVGRFDPERARERLRNSFHPEHTQVIIFDGERIGFHTFRPADDGFHLDHLYIHPRCQSQGVGSYVMRYLLAQSDAQQRPVHLGALRDSPANRFYQRHGFVQVCEDEWDIYYIRPADEKIARVQEIFSKIMGYQAAHENLAVELDVLIGAGVLTAEDRDFLEAHAIDYKPHALTDYHAMDMFHVPTEEGCIFIGPGGPPLPKHTARLPELAAVIERVLRLPLPADDLMLHIEFTPEDGVGIASGLLVFILHRPEWRTHAAAVKEIAQEHGLAPFQDSPDIQGNYLLSFTLAVDPSVLARIEIDLLRRGLGLTDEEPITYACGALEPA